MPLERCLFCGEMRWLGLFFRVCRECWRAEPDPLERYSRIIRERGLVPTPGSVVYRPEKERGRKEC